MAEVEKLGTGRSVDEGTNGSNLAPGRRILFLKKSVKGSEKTAEHFVYQGKEQRRAKEDSSRRRLEWMDLESVDMAHAMGGRGLG